jgi:hypothetical protein
MRRSIAMCAMVVAGLLSWTMLPMGATRLAEAGSETCADMLVGKAFTCEVAGEGQAEPLCFQFVPAVSPPTGVGGDFQLNVSPLSLPGGPAPCPSSMSGPIGCNCRPEGDINTPLFDQDKYRFLCTGVLGFTIGPIAIVGTQSGLEALTLIGDGLFLGVDEGGGESFFFKCQQVQVQ